MPPLLILALGIATVLGMIIILRANAFFALISAALLVSLLAPGPVAEKVSRVGAAFGTTAGGIGIVIALAAVIGMCMQQSYAADRVVLWFLRMLGLRRGDVALLASGFVLSVPVFFDTVFYLLIPLARSMYRRTGRDYAKYVMAIGAGGVATHSLVPPTPGPLVTAANLGVDLGTMMMVGAAAALPAALAGMLVAVRINARMPIPMRSVGEADQQESPPDDHLPGLLPSLLPIVVPVALIAANTIVQAVSPDAPLAGITAVIGNPSLAMLIATVIALWLYLRRRRPSGEQVKHQVESSLMSGGLIILITAAGGAFGAMLQAAQIGPAIQDLFSTGPGGSGFALLALGFGVASLLKFAQGSSTVSMITTSAMLGAIVTPDSLSFHPVYLAAAVGSGAMVGSWMNDSGFWIISKMGALTEMETLRTWTVVAAAVGCGGFLATLVLAAVLPLR
jgi:GntP family gluconate:H+ symporter